MAQAAVDAFGGIDILVNNAAIMTDLPPYGLGNMPVTDWDRVMDVILRGPLLCTQIVVPSMVSRGGGRIINGLFAGAFMMGSIRARSPARRRTSSARCCSSAPAPATGSTATRSTSTAAGSPASDSPFTWARSGACGRRGCA